MSSLALHRASELAPVWSATEPVILPTLFGEGYGLYCTQRSSFVLSFLVHVLGLALLLTSGRYLVEHHREIRQQVIGVVTDVSPYILPPSASKAGGGGGGGDRDKLSASKGTLPRLSRQQLAPPAVIVRNENPKLPVEATVVVPPEIHLPQTASLDREELSGYRNDALRWFLWGHRRDRHSNGLAKRSVPSPGNAK